jgi:hypothetical protein
MDEIRAFYLSAFFPLSFFWSFNYSTTVSVMISIMFLVKIFTTLIPAWNVRLTKTTLYMTFCSSSNYVRMNPSKQGWIEQRDKCLQQTTRNQEIKNSSEIFQSILLMVHEFRNVTPLDDVGFLESFRWCNDYTECCHNW